MRSMSERFEANFEPDWGRSVRPPPAPVIPVSRRELVPITRRVAVQASERISLKGEDGNPAMWIVLSGAIQSTLSGQGGREHLLGHVRPGGLIGEQSVLGKVAYSCDLFWMADQDSLLGEVAHGALIEAMRLCPELLLDVIAIINSKTAVLLRDIERGAFATSAAQTAALLLKLTDEKGYVEASQARLAHLSGKTRMTIGTQLRSLARNGVISQERSRIRLVDRACLEDARSRR